MIHTLLIMIAVKKVKGIEGSLLLRKVYCSYLCYRRQSMRQTKATHGALTLIYIIKVLGAMRLELLERQFHSGILLLSIQHRAR